MHYEVILVFYYFLAENLGSFIAAVTDLSLQSGALCLRSLSSFFNFAIHVVIDTCNCGCGSILRIGKLLQGLRLRLLRANHASSAFFS